MISIRLRAALLLLPLVASEALADAIDGNWCHPDGRRLSIRGAEIVTPGGNRLNGNYGRHFYDYKIPPGEPSSGENVFMTLMGEYVVHLRIGTEPPGRDPVEVWNRCAPSVSSLDAAPGFAG